VRALNPAAYYAPESARERAHQNESTGTSDATVAGEEGAVSTRADYTPEEWTAIRETPAKAVVAMERASPSGFLGRRRERKAQERGFAAAISAYAGMGLVEALKAAAEEEGKLVDKLRAADRPVADEAITAAGAARRAIEARGSHEELEAFQISVIGACEEVALADQEGGPGEISQAEALLLQRLAQALGRPDYTPGNPDFTPPGRQPRLITVGLDDSGSGRGVGQARR
jgi:hypothetical protein